MSKAFAHAAKPSARVPLRRGARAPVRADRMAVLAPALRVGAVHDPAEREAEETARRVMAAPAPVLAEPPAAPPGARPEGSAGIGRAAEDQPNLDELVEPPLPADQQDIEVPPAEDVNTDAMSAEDTSEVDAGTPVDTSGDPIEALRREAAVGREGGPAPADVSARVANPGPGRRLPGALRRFMEARFGLSFGRVRVHDTSADRRAAARIGARAFTHREAIWLGTGESVENRPLMAHELTHVVQQTEGSGALPQHRGSAGEGPPAQPPGAKVGREPVLRRGYIEDKGEEYARYVPGYTLITVLVGQTLISRERVGMTAENLLGGLMGLHPLGTVLFDRLKEAQIIDEAFVWVREKLSDLDLTWSRVERLLDQIWDAAVSWSPVDNLTALFRPLVNDVISFVAAIGGKILEFVIRGALKLAGPHADRIWGILQEARENLNLILEDPIGFAKNLVRAVVGGFTQFGSNILEHLKKGLLGWLFGALGGAGITLPERLDFKGLISIGLQVLGLTYERFRAKLVKALGPKGEQKVRMIEASVEVVKILVTEGFAGIWQKLIGMIEGFKETVIGGIRDFVITSVVKAGLGWVAGLSNPVGAVVKVVLAIYDLIVAFIERLEQIAAVAQSIFSSMGAIARGQVSEAANFVEETIGRTVPVVISFLAAVLGLGGISRSIRNVIKKIQAPVDRAMTKLVTFLVKKAKKLFSKLISKVNRKRKLPSRNFKIGTVKHRIFLKEKGGKVELWMNRAEEPLAVHEAADRAALAGIADNKSKGEGEQIAAELPEAAKETKQTAAKVDLNSENKNQLEYLKKLDEALAAAAKELTEAGVDIGKFPGVAPQEAGKPGTIRADEPRDPTFEGTFGTYKVLGGEAQGKIRTVGPDGKPVETEFQRSRFYEIDHTIEKRFPKAIIESLKALDPAQPAEARSEAAVSIASLKREDRTKNAVPGEPAGKAAAGRSDAGSPPFGLIGAGEMTKIPETAPEFPSIAVYHRNHIEQKGKGLLTEWKAVEAASKAEDPAAALRGYIKLQLDAEIKEMKAQLKADERVDPKVTAALTANLESARKRNIELYGLDQPATPKRAPAGRKQPGAEATTSTFTFKGGNAGVPDFTVLEGKAGPYGALDKGVGDFFQKDHIVDKAYPLRAQSLPLFTAGDLDTIEAQASLGVPLAGDAATRMAALRRLVGSGLPLFTEKSGVRGYKEASGYAVLLYRPLALEVTSRTGREEDVAALRGRGLSGATSAAVRYVRENDRDFLTSARAAMQTPFRETFLTRTELHAGHAADLYATEIQRVASLNNASPDANNAAKAQMAQIAGTVRGSLADARSRTEALFAAP